MGFNARTQSYKSDQLGARKMLLRSLFPEYDGFALRLSKQLTVNREGAQRAEP